jgi:hypothetical protein
MVKEIDGTHIVGHGGSTNGQMSAFEMAPARGFAITVLTNANRGSELHHNVVVWARECYLGVIDREAAELAPGEAQLREYTGRYTAAMNDLDLYLENGALMAQMTPHGGFPKPDSTPGPTPPPTRLSLREGEQVVALDPPFTGGRGEFLRGKDGSIEWLRIGGRICRRQP